MHACPASSLDVPDEQAVRLVVLRTEATYKNGSTKSEALKAVTDILNNRGPSPRIYRNTLAFIAPDADNLNSLRAEVRRYIAWKSILTDKDDLNLDGAQIRETNSNLQRSNQTVELRVKETYSWLMVPFIDQYGDMKEIQWEINSISGGDDSIVSKAAKKMIQSEQIITNWAPALLQMSLNDLLWKDNNDTGRGNIQKEIFRATIQENGKTSTVQAYLMNQSVSENSDLYISLRAQIFELQNIIERFKTESKH